MRLERCFGVLIYWNKSPDDKLNVDTFYKSGAYASLYKSYGDTVDERKAEDITVSIVRDSKPDGLFQYFAEHGIRMENPYRGIYRVLDAVLFPTQIIVTKELDGESHTWLKALSDKLKKEQLKALLERTDRLTGKLDRELADAVLEVSIRANGEIVEELKGDESMCQALLEIMEPEINKITEKVRKETEEKVRKETEEKVRKETEERDRIQDMSTAKKMITSGKFSIEEVKEFVPRLSVDEIRNLEKELARS